MPLIQSASNAAKNKNIAELIEANKNKPEGKKRPLKQIVAIGYSNQRKNK